MSSPLTHVDQHGAARMVDVSEKPITSRSATAGATISMNTTALNAIQDNALGKGDALAVARIAGILAAKRVDELIPLCHTLPLNEVKIDFEFVETGISVVAMASTNSKTGVEMEALTACCIAALTIYDMAKSVDRLMVIDGVRLLTKTGGKSGDIDNRVEP